MAFEDCLARAKEIAGETFTTAKAERMAEKFHAILKSEYERGITDPAALGSRLVKEGQEYARRALQAKYNALLNREALLTQYDHTMRVWGKPGNADLAEGLKAILIGTGVARHRAGTSIMSVAPAKFVRAVAGLVTALDRVVPNGRDKFLSGKMDRELVIAAWELGLKKKGLDHDLGKVSEDAVKIAQTVQDHNNLMRLSLNRAGADISELPERLVSQSARSEMVRAGGATEAEAATNYAKFVAERLDWHRTMNDVLPEKRQEVLESIARDYLHGYHFSMSPEPPTGLKGVGNMGRGMSHERVLHFKDAEAAWEYHQKYVGGSVSGAIAHEYETATRKLTIMERLGPNPELTFQKLTNMIQAELKRQKREGEAKAVQDMADKLSKTAWKTLLGQDRVASNKMLATVSSVWGNADRLAFLAGSLFSSIGDVVNAGMAWHTTTGEGMFKGIAQAVSNVVTGPGGKVMVEKAADMGVRSDIHLRSVMSTMVTAEDSLPNITSQAVNWMFLLNGVTLMSDRNRVGFGIDLGRHLGEQAISKGWKDLDPALQRTLTRYGITAPEWEALRPASQLHPESGLQLMAPENVEALPAEAFRDYVASQGKTVTPRSLTRAKEQIVSDLTTFYRDRSNIAQLEPDAATRNFMFQGTNSGTWYGAFLRSFWLFKSYPVAFTRQVLGGMIYGSGEATNLGDAFRQTGVVSGLAQIFLYSSAVGYLSYALKEYAKGRKPVTDFAQHPEVILKAMSQGGGLGYLGTYIVGDSMSGYGRSSLAATFGPQMGAVGSMVDAWMTARDAAFAGKPTANVVGRAAVSTIRNHIPFGTFPGVGLALDYSIFYHLHEGMSPGFMRRMEANRRKAGGDYWLPPTQYAGGPFQ